MAARWRGGRPDGVAARASNRYARCVLRAAGSLLFWAGITVSSVLLFPVALLIWLVTLPFDPRRRVLHQFTCFWASLYTWLNPAWRVQIVGRENVRPDVAYVMVANHLSFLDILVLFRLRRHFKWVSKVEMFKIPAIGWNMWLNRYVPLKRGDKQSVQTMMQICRERLAEGSSLMIFPEGTRSRDGKLSKFKTGAFQLALETKSPILPIVVSGTSKTLPKHGFVLRGHHEIGIRVLPAIPHETFAALSIEELTARMRAMYVRETGTDGLADADAAPASGDARATGS
ncbi:MAG: 1-acyl-sn-glycerol-3-phosphate acyltransferase [Deltaproteobacteria bacterium]|nr:1-acyl-sn-glycerol-3-phosphate acyltransferase [Deltaproteobacteria bacterium]